MRRMPWRARVVFVVLAALQACSSTPKLSDEGRSVRGVVGLVTDLEHAYEQRDESALMAGMAKEFPDRETLQRTVQSVFDRFDRIDLTITVERIHLEGETATVYLHWDAQWRAQGSAPIARQGTARFEVGTDGRPMLTAVLGDNPFAATPANSP